MQPQPRQLFVREQMALRSEFGGAFKGSDVIMRLGGKANRRAGQRRATASAEAAGRPGRRLERRDLALRDGNRVVRETGKDAYWRASMSAAAIAMAPEDALRLAPRLELDRAA